MRIETLSTLMPSGILFSVAKSRTSAKVRSAEVHGGPQRGRERSAARLQPARDEIPSHFMNAMVRNEPQGVKLSTTGIGGSRARAKRESVVGEQHSSRRRRSRLGDEEAAAGGGLPSRRSVLVELARVALRDSDADQAGAAWRACPEARRRCAACEHRALRARGRSDEHARVAPNASTQAASSAGLWLPTHLLRNAAPQRRQEVARVVERLERGQERERAGGVRRAASSVRT